MFEFLKVMMGCGTAISLFAIYMNYRSKGIGVLFGKGRRVSRSEVENIQAELKALRENAEAMRAESGRSQEMMADILLSMEDQRRALQSADPYEAE
jgi:hypothetical protein